MWLGLVIVVVGLPPLLHSSVLVVFNNFLISDATDISKITSDHHRSFFAVSLYPLYFFANTPFKAGLNLLKNEGFSGIPPLFTNIFQGLNLESKH